MRRRKGWRSRKRLCRRDNSPPKGAFCLRIVNCKLGYCPFFLHCYFQFLIFRYGLVPLPDQVERVDKAVAATQVITYNGAS